MNMANHHNCVLSTGTVSVIKKSALEAVGLWSGQTITEDCELGLRLHQHGFRGVYVPKPLGKGLMPTDLKALKVQRERWVFGNMQTFVNFLKTSKQKLKLSQLLGIATQLTAWFNFLLLPVLAAATGFGLNLLLGQNIYHTIGTVAVASLGFGILSKWLFFQIALRRTDKPFSAANHAFLVHMGLVWEGATSWIRCLCGENIRFKRTNKFLGKVAGAKIIPNLLLFSLTTLAGVFAIASGNVSWGLAALVLALPFLSVYYLKHITHQTYQLASLNSTPALSKAA
jgi:cellulose synthase/poly-beta-1,6-N-acetylglucosamine synthase-like glycosyltransferase